MDSGQWWPASRAESPTFFEWYLLRQRFRLIFAAMANSLLKPLLDWMVKPRG